MKIRVSVLLSVILCVFTTFGLLACNRHVHYGDWETVREAGCFITREESRVCPGCGETETRISPALGHNYIGGFCTVCERHDWSVTDISDPQLYNSDYCFRALAHEEHWEGMQALYSLIDKDAQEYHNGESDATVLGEYDYGALGLTKEEASAVCKVYLDDHPLFYWISKTITVSVWDNMKTLTVFVDGDYTNPTVRSSLNQTIYETANRWRANTSEIAYLAALSYHDTIIERVDYLPSDAVFPNGTHWAHNIVGVFDGMDVVCEGYARTFQLLLNLTGIENILVTGYSNGDSHAWNLVKLDDGEWYWFDLTYDDSPNWMWGVKYNYFAVNDTDNLNWQDDGNIYSNAPFSFLDEHHPDNGSGANYLSPLPARAEGKYAGVGELLLRKTFTVGDFTYAHAGHKAVQLVKCTSEGDIYIPAFVEYDGVKYEVISVGGITKDGLFSDELGENIKTPNGQGGYTHDFIYYEVFRGKDRIPNVAYKFGTLYFPETIRFLWANAIPDVTAFSVAENNPYYTAVDGVLFTKDLYTLIRYPAFSERKEYVIPDETVWVAHNSFSMPGGSKITYDPDTHKQIFTPLYKRYLQKITIGKNVANSGGLANWGSGWRMPKTGNGVTIINVIVHEFDYIMKSDIEIMISEENPYLHFENGLVRNIIKNRFGTI